MCAVERQSFADKESPPRLDHLLSRPIHERPSPLPTIDGADEGASVMPCVQAGMMGRSSRLKKRTLKFFGLR